MFLSNTPRPFQFFCCFFFFCWTIALRKKLTKNYLSWRKELFKISKFKKIILGKYLSFYSNGKSVKKLDWTWWIKLSTFRFWFGKPKEKTAINYCLVSVQLLLGIFYETNRWIISADLCGLNCELLCVDSCIFNYFVGLLCETSNTVLFV